MYEVNQLPYKVILERDWPRWYSYDYYITHCGYRYIKPLRFYDTNVRWLCDKPGCGAWLEQRKPDAKTTLIFQRKEHNHPPYPEHMQLNYPFPTKPGKNGISYEVLKTRCLCLGKESIPITDLQENSNKPRSKPKIDNLNTRFKAGEIL